MGGSVVARPASGNALAQFRVLPWATPLQSQDSFWLPPAPVASAMPRPLPTPPGPLRPAALLPPAAWASADASIDLRGASAASLKLPAGHAVAAVTVSSDRVAQAAPAANALANVMSPDIAMQARAFGVVDTAIAQQAASGHLPSQAFSPTPASWTAASSTAAPPTSTSSMYAGSSPSAAHTAEARMPPPVFDPAWLAQTREQVADMKLASFLFSIRGKPWPPDQPLPATTRTPGPGSYPALPWLQTRTPILVESEIISPALREASLPGSDGRSASAVVTPVPLQDAGSAGPVSAMAARARVEREGLPAPALGPMRSAPGEMSGVPVERQEDAARWRTPMSASTIMRRGVAASPPGVEPGAVLQDEGLHLTRDKSAAAIIAASPAGAPEAELASLQRTAGLDRGSSVGEKTMVSIEQTNLAVKPLPVATEIQPMRVAEPLARDLGLREGQIVKGMVESENGAPASRSAA